MSWTERDHARLATLFDYGPDRLMASERVPYPGYRPEVREAPNGDTKECAGCAGTGDAAAAFDGGEGPHDICNGTGRVPNTDAGPAGKRFLHVALKYNPPTGAEEYLARAHWEACKVATALGVPAAYRPHESDGTLRVLEYPSAGHTWASFVHGRCRDCGVEYSEDLERTGVCPALTPGAGTAEHTDFDLFTIVLWRSHPADLELGDHPSDAGPGAPSPLDLARRMSPGLHIGEIGELVGLGPATPHRVPARPYVQKSIVYFAVPDHGAALPVSEATRAVRRVWDAPVTVGEWLKARIDRSRYYAWRSR